MTVTVVKDGTATLMAAVKRLMKQEVLVGIPDSTADRQPDPQEPDNDINNAVLGYIHEFGSPAQNIPPRPFLIPGVESIAKQATAIFKKAGEKALSGQLNEIDRALNAVGLLAAAAVQQKITDGPFVPLAPRTIAQRKARGRTGDKPLLDTGALRAAITYVVRNKGS